MKYSADRLSDLLDAGRRFLEDPTDPDQWQVFLARLESLEREEAAQSAAASRSENHPALKPPDPAPNPVIHRRVEPKSPPRTAAWMWAAVLTVVLIVGMLFAARTGMIDRLTALLAPPTEVIAPTPLQPPTSSPQTIGGPVLAQGVTSGEMTDLQPMVRYQFDGRTGDTVSITVRAENFDPYLLLLTADDVLIATDDDCGSLRRACIEALTLPDDGTYLVVVESFDRRSTGAFTIDFALVPGASSPTEAAQDVCPPTRPVGRIVTAEQSLNLRAGPDAGFPVVGLVYPGECFALIERSRSSAWLQIRTPSGRTGWLFANLMQVEGDIAPLPIAGS
ncbi:MAG: SH3 domain-containing protein [Anaerolineae bacterium]|nr:SH3 domain-containing protein [Anaerolineae bacterium]NUQ07124.1 SH3 domain-containing protein [Anaerolineae bacterium]